MSYLTTLIIVLTSALFIEWFFKEHLFHSLKERMLCVTIALVSITIWDLYAIPRRHWVFPGQGILGIFIGPIPIEEFLWTVWVPYFWVTIYKAAHIITDKKRNTK